MPEASEPKADCYSDGERAAMVWTQTFRAVLLAPLLAVLARFRVTANHVTLLSVAVGLSFCPLFFWSKPWALAALALHVLLDGLDGPLARHTGAASRRGSLTDTMCDQLVVVATTTTLMAAHVVGVVPGAVYVFVYTMVVVFAMVRNAMEIPYSWVVRPRFFVYAWLAIEIYVAPLQGSIDLVLWVFNVLLAWKMLTGFLKIRGKV